MNRYLAIGISDEDCDLLVWSEEFECPCPASVDEQRDMAIAVLNGKKESHIELVRVLIVKNDNVVDDFNVD
jgi:hypothetical protein